MDPLLEAIPILRHFDVYERTVLARSMELRELSAGEILIDGRPTLSRNSVRMGRSGERDTRGDGQVGKASGSALPEE